MNFKKCNKCEKVKEYSFFYKSKTLKEGGGVLAKNVLKYIENLVIL